MKINVKSKSFTALISIFFAIIFWVFVMADSNTTRIEDIRNIPISIRGEDGLSLKGLVVTEKSKDQGNMRVEGSVNAIGNISGNNANAYVDLSGINEPGEYDLTVYTYVNNSAVVVKSFTPSKVKIIVEKYVEKQVPVEIEYDKEITGKYWVNEAKIQNKRVTVAGGQSVVNSVAKGVIKVDTDMLTSSYENDPMQVYEASLPITFVNESNNEITGVLNQSSIVSIDLLSRKTVKLDVQGAIKGSPAPGYTIDSIDQNVKEIDVVGKREVLSRLDSMLVSPIDVSGLSSSKVTDVTIEPVDGVKIIGSDKVKVSVNIKNYVEN